ncbi:MAG: hypothetical protein HYV27_24030 [Candidatus Hydrogenedentes bacterium]|nr:hypothetical protein [Candidatus Hydrogenedentota bacterium]
MSSQEPHQFPPARRQKEPYPRMIIVCIVISLTLSFVMAFVLMGDFIERNQGGYLTPALESPPVPKIPDNWTLPEDAAPTATFKESMQAGETPQPAPADPLVDPATGVPVPDVPPSP